MQQDDHSYSLAQAAALAAPSRALRLWCRDCSAGASERCVDEHPASLCNLNKAGLLTASDGDAAPPCRGLSVLWLDNNSLLKEAGAAAAAAPDDVSAMACDVVEKTLAEDLVTSGAIARRRRTSSPAPSEPGSAVDAQPVGLAGLPDDELLQVLSFLKPEELLRCRLVCPRWRDLVMHPTLWRRVNLDLDAQVVLKAAMRLAPCADSFAACFLTDVEVQSYCTLLWQTSCALRSMKLNIYNKGLGLAALAIQRQVSLGRLRKLHIWLDERASQCPGVHFLLQTVDNIAGLVNLNIKLTSAAPKDPLLLGLPSAEGQPSGASLQTLSLKMDELEPRLSRYLSQHAATLRKLTVMADAPGLADTLASLPNLRELHCPQLAGMTALARCSSLRKFTLTIDFNSENPPKTPLSEARNFLKASTGMLKEVVLEFPDGEDNAEVVNLVLALCGRHGPVNSVLERLYLQTEGDDFEPPLQLRPLTAILHRLPMLQRLEVDGTTTPDFLDAIDATTLPLLRLLMVNSGGQCSHAWLHSPEVQALLARMPGLHVEITFPNCSNSYLDDEEMANAQARCQLCLDWPACHRQMMDDDINVILFSHPKGDKCDLCAELAKRENRRHDWRPCVLVSASNADT